MIILHLGCGLDYRPGAVNVDRYDLTAADLQADALRLPLAGGSVARIEACQLVEHLGHAGTIYGLAEWLRVLEPGGILLIETPDRSAACLPAADPNPPASALHRLFGLPWPGYAHRTLFDENDLHTLAEQARLAEVEITRTDAPELTLRLTARKSDDLLVELRSRLHTGFVAAGIVDPLTAPPYLSHLETICDQVLAAAVAVPRDGEAACLTAILGAAARHDPRAAQVAIQALVAGGVVRAAAAKPYLRLVRSLEEEVFPARLAACLRQSTALPGTQAMRLHQLANQTSLYLTARLHPGEAALRSIREWFDNTTETLTAADREITFFCAETVAVLSRRQTAQGARAFARNDLDAAQQHFEAATAYDADNSLPVWNLARLALTENRRLDALDHYAMLLELLPGAADALRAEMDAATGREPDALAHFLGPVGEVGIA